MEQLTSESIVLILGQLLKFDTKLNIIGKLCFRYCYESTPHFFSVDIHHSMYFNPTNRHLWVEEVDEADNHTQEKFPSNLSPHRVSLHDNHAKLDGARENVMQSRNKEPVKIISNICEDSSICEENDHRMSPGNARIMEEPHRSNSSDNMNAINCNKMSIENVRTIVDTSLMLLPCKLEPSDCQNDVEEGASIDSKNIANSSDIFKEIPCSPSNVNDANTHFNDNSSPDSSLDYIGLIDDSFTQSSFDRVVGASEKRVRYFDATESRGEKRPSGDLDSSTSEGSSVPSMRSKKMKVLTCTTCGEKFTKRRAAVSHERTHLQKKLFTCPRCEEGFSTRSKLNRHLRKQCSTPQTLVSVDPSGSVYKNKLDVDLTEPNSLSHTENISIENSSSFSNLAETVCSDVQDETFRQELSMHSNSFAQTEPTGVVINANSSETDTLNVGENDDVTSETNIKATNGEVNSDQRKDEEDIFCTASRSDSQGDSKKIVTEKVTEKSISGEANTLLMGHIDENIRLRMYKFDRLWRYHEKYVCGVCSLLCGDISTLTHHLQSFHEREDEEYHCLSQRCDKTFSSMATAHAHEFATHTLSDLSNLSPFSKNVSVTSNNIKCAYCPYISPRYFFNLIDYYDHFIEFHHMGSILELLSFAPYQPVSSCGKYSETSNAALLSIDKSFFDVLKNVPYLPKNRFEEIFKDHFTNLLRYRNGFVCFVCFRVFPLTNNLIRHMFSIHGIAKVFVCRERNCLELFNSRWHTIYHEKIHMNDNVKKSLDSGESKRIETESAVINKTYVKERGIQNYVENDFIHGESGSHLKLKANLLFK